jgi:AcrR family transcriptional regulator
MNKQQQRAQVTRSRILKAAEDCFAQAGYDGTGVAAICREAGVSKGAFYHHFSSKQDVFLQLLHNWLGGMDSQLAALSAGAGDVSDRLLAMSGLVGTVLRVAGKRLPLYLEFWNQAARDPLVWETTIEPYRRYRAFFTDMIDKGISEGSLKAVNPESAASVVVALAVGLLIQGLLDSDGVDWEQVSQEGIQILLDGLSKA